MKILVVEDQIVAATQLMAVVRSLGHEVEHVQDSTQAVTRVWQGGFRVVVSDWKMPGISGLDLCRQIRTQGGDYVYFILVSLTRVTRENRRQALDAGVDDFLMKPVDPDELSMRFHVADRILGLSAKVKELEEFLPICGYCKNIRDDKKYWQRIEAYFGERQGTQFTHSVCPGCYDKFIAPELRAAGLDPEKTKPGGHA
jgi:phosphoserine phosphatase RsbU/P